MDASGKPNLLIIEDEPLIAFDLEAMLKANGYKVLGVVSDIFEAAELATLSEVDIALVDIQLPRGPDGIAIAEWLRREHGIASLFVSGGIGDATEARALSVRPIGFVDKPYSESWLLGALGAAAAMQKVGVDI